MDVTQLGLVESVPCGRKDKDKFHKKRQADAVCIPEDNELGFGIGLQATLVNRKETSMLLGGRNPHPNWGDHRVEAAVNCKKIWILLGD
jgi:hypothetical protein